MRVATVLEELVPKDKTGPSRTGQLVNAQGGEGETNVWGKRSEWVDYSGRIDGEKIGVVMFTRAQYRAPFVVPNVAGEKTD